MAFSPIFQRPFPATFDRRAAAAAASLAPVAGMAAWWKIDTISASDGDLIGTWNDSSGGANNLSQTSTARPTYKTAQINGYSCLRFDGSNDCMATTGAIGCRTIFVVSKIATLSDNNYVFDMRTSIANGYIYDGPGPFGPNWTALYVNKSSKTLTFANFATNAWSLAVIQGSSTGTSAIRLMRYYNSGIATHSGDIAEIIIYADALSAGDRLTTETYLMSKYGIT